MASIRITLRSDMCAGSGEATGLTVDNDLCMDSSGLPYIPARRIKGCLRQAARELEAAGCLPGREEQIEALFGNSTGREGCLVLRDAKLLGAEAMEDWLKTSVPEALKLAAAPLNVARQFTCVRGQTKLNNGVAEKGTLRYTRVMERYNTLDDKAETTLEAPVSFRLASETDDAVRKSLAELLRDCCCATRHMGTHRNRGLGHVRVELIGQSELEKGQRANKLQASEEDDGKKYSIEYRIRLDAPVTLVGCAEELSEIPARSVIGCAAGAYLQGGSAEDAAFRDLFLNGTVRWSSLTPVVNGMRTDPTPLMMTYLKNEKQYKNLLAADPAELEGIKQKSAEGTYSARTENGFVITRVESRTLYHHSTGEDATLYTQSSLDAGMIYGGVVTLPARLKDMVVELLRNARFAFGRSRSAQYAACSLFGEPKAKELTDEKRASEGAVYVVLQSDLLLSGEDGVFETDDRHVRAALASALGLENELPDGKKDFCQYHTIGGYHSLWQLQRPQLPVTRGGSVYCFKSACGELPRQFTLGEYPQEGFGQCRIYTEAEMRSLETITTAPVDIRKAEDANGNWPGKLQSALIVSADREQFRAAVRKKYHDYSTNKKYRDQIIDRGMIGRLRLMLSEAADYSDLRKRTESIRQSDKNSERTVPNAERVAALLTSLYGENKSEPSFEPLLRDTPALWALTREDGAAMAQLRKRWWKEPLEMFLHLAYYGSNAKGA